MGGPSLVDFSTLTTADAHKLALDAYEAHRRAVYLMASDMLDFRPAKPGMSREIQTEQIAREYLGIAVALMRRDRERERTHAS